MDVLGNIKNELKKCAKKEKAILLSRFFKTGPGEYGEGDKFIGVVVPDQRKITKKYYKEISYTEIIALLHSEIHEYRLISLFLLISKYEYAKDEKTKDEIVELYKKNFDYINNWDLVDLSASKILGDFLYNFKKDRKILYEFAKTDHLWTQRIAILSTFYFIRNNDFNDTLNIAEILINHKHDLIHKAVGWMLREVGNRNFSKEKNFLLKFYKKMPRTMLRYSIEKFDPELRSKFLKGIV